MIAGPRSQQSAYPRKAKEVGNMALTRDFKKTVVARVERDPAFAKALLDEAATLFRRTGDRTSHSPRFGERDNWL